jgi:hypothetical protein
MKLRGNGKIVSACLISEKVDEFELNFSIRNLGLHQVCRANLISVVMSKLAVTCIREISGTPIDRIGFFFHVFTQPSVQMLV